jgi:hypothetical protein
MAWGPRTPEQAEEHHRQTMMAAAAKPHKEKAERLEARCAKQERVIDILIRHLRQHCDADFVIELIAELLGADE